MASLVFHRRGLRRTVFAVALAAATAAVATALGGCAAAPSDALAPRVAIDGRPNGIAIRASA